MEMLKLNAVQSDETDAFCPCCGGGNYEGNRQSETLYALAAQEAPRLRFEGRIEEARQVLNAFWDIWTENFLRHEWRCLDCGSSFDG